MQALRSAGDWSLGRRNTEHSIHEAYLESIEAARHYIYIENQFFISSTSSDGVENKVVKAIFNRIKKAYKAGELFRVIIFLPLMPAFEANLEEQKGKVMQIQIGLENETLGKGPHSLIEKVRELLGDSGLTPDYFILVCSLRKWEFRPSDGFPVTEIIYIHSKVGCGHRSS